MNNVVRKLTGTNTRWPSAKTLLFAPYVKRYASTESNSTFNIDRYTIKEDRVYVENKS